MPLPKSPTVFVIQSNNIFSNALFHLILAAAQSVNAEVSRADQMVIGDNIEESIQSAISKSSLVIVDVSDPNPEIMYEFGTAKASGKPLIVISQEQRSVPFSIANAHIILSYDLSESPQHIVSRLAELISMAINSPEEFKRHKTKEARATRNEIFVSYSHCDRSFLDRLLVHLKPIEKEGVLDLWVDTRLKAGDQWKKEIEKALTRATTAILLVSADFLASDFITDNELPPLLGKAQEHGTRIIPVIVKPCRFTRDKNLKHFQAINNPQMPLVLLPYGEQEVIYDLIAKEVENWMAAG